MSRKRKKPVSLSGEQRERLEGLIFGGNAPVRKMTHPRILLKAGEGGSQGAAAWPGTRIAEAPGISRSTASRVRERFVEEGPEAALVHRKPKRGKPCKLDGSQEAHLIALACSEPPKGKNAGACALWPSVS